MAAAAPVPEYIVFDITPLPEEDYIWQGHQHEVSLLDPESDISRLDNPNEVVLPLREVTVLIEYPLNLPAEFRIHSKRPEGFTRVELIREISRIYHHIYEENQEGRYETMLHGLDALVLEEIVVRVRDGAYVLDPSVGS